MCQVERHGERRRERERGSKIDRESECETNTPTYTDGHAHAHTDSRQEEREIDTGRCRDTKGQTHAHTPATNRQMDGRKSSRWPRVYTEGQLGGGRTGAFSLNWSSLLPHAQTCPFANLQQGTCFREYRHRRKGADRQTDVSSSSTPIQ